MNGSMKFAWTGVLCVALLATPLDGQTRELVGLSVIDRETGQALPEARHRGEAWIAGTPGHRYRVRLTNHSNERVLAVLSVDGVNAISGETADPAQAGYVIGPWQTAEVDGWRKSHEEIAGFVFTDIGDSYASRTGRPGHVGVIGIAVFEEARPKQAAWIDSDQRRIGSEARGNAAAGSASTNAQAAASETAPPATRQSIGTGHGQREWSRVSTSAFVRASRTPSTVIEVRYDDHAALVARGVLPHSTHDRYRPVAFPSGFVPDPPPRWRR